MTDTERPRREITYASVGVDVGVEAQAARLLYQASRLTWANRRGQLGEVVVPFEDFRSLRYIDVAGLPEGTVFSGNSDGQATKAEIAERAHRYNTAGFDLMAMLTDDTVIKGGEPVVVKSVLEVNTLGEDESRLPFVLELAEGYFGSAREANVVVLNGEIAQLNDRMGNMDRFMFNWSGDVSWFANKSRLISGREVRFGDYIVGLAEPGFRCNGISLPRRVLKNEYGERWEDTPWKGGKLIDHILTPSRIYTRAVVDMTGGWDLKREPKAVIHGAAHISGGGIPEKLGSALKPSGLGAEIDDPFDPCELMLHC